MSASTGRALVGAIRWDAWSDDTSDGITQFVEGDLADDPSRLPWFASIDANGQASIDGDSQAVMDQEIGLASQAGLNYWAFDFYGGGSGMDHALQLYLGSPLQSLIDFALIDGAGWGTTAQNYPAVMDTRAALMEHAGYQTVLGGRALYYVMAPSAAILDGNWGGSLAAMKTALDYLRVEVTTATGHDPYIVLMDGDNAGAAGMMQALGANAISAYAVSGSGTSLPASALTAVAEASWATQASQAASIPTVMTGWDPAPRIADTPPWGSSGTTTYQTPSPTQVGQLVSDSLAFVAANPAADPADTVLVYSWDEYDEGGNTLDPSYTGNGQAGDAAVLDAVGAALNGAETVATSTATDGSFIHTTAAGATEYFSPGGTLTSITATDGSRTVYAADGTVDRYGASGGLQQVDDPNGSTGLVQADGVTLWYDVNGTLLDQVNPDGSTTEFAADGSIAFAVQPDGTKVVPYTGNGGGSLLYDPAGDYLGHVVPQGNGATEFYGPDGSLVSVTSADASVTFFPASGAVAGTGAIAGGAAEMVTGDGANTVLLGNGDARVQSGPGSVLMFLGSGADTVASGGSDTLVAQGGADTIFAAGNAAAFGATGSLVFVGGSGSSTVIGGGGSGTVFGGSGSGDVVFGGAGAMLVLGGAAPLRFVGGVSGGAGADTIFGGTGGGFIAAGLNDTVTAGAGATTVTGAPGAQLWLMGSARNLLAAGSGNETLSAASSTGSNLLFAGTGADTLIGGGGSDRFVAGSGSALFATGLGADLFEFGNGHAGGSDTISGFRPGTDHVALYGYGSYTLVPGPSETLLLPDGTKLTFAGVNGLGSNAFA